MIDDEIVISADIKSFQEINQAGTGYVTMCPIVFDIENDNYKCTFNELSL